MSQIFNRVSRIIKANKNDSEPSLADFYIKSEDDELKSIIDELSNKKTQQDNFNKNSENSKVESDLNFEDACLVLDINQNSSVDEIKIAYKTKVKEYHPDKVSGLGEELQKLAQLKTQQINSAYNVIKKFRNFN
jgi:DnaJ-domain-containing protein 1